ncbi:Retrovirus-related Pol polyprotein from transposon TNT 1-94 [Anthophora quadrimaculata]
MTVEYQTLMKNGTWSLVPRPKDKKILTNRWVFKTKHNNDGSLNKYKARLVARGHTQQRGIDYQEIFAPVARYEIIRTLLATAANYEMHVHHMDVVSAYVQGDLNDEIYMEQPEAFEKRGEEDMVCKLIKPLYGLKQSGREWYKKIDSYITVQGARRTEADPCVYVFGNDENRVIMVIYVDDIILASKNMKKLIEIKDLLKSKFEMTDSGPISEILGIRIERNGETGSIKLSQARYIEGLIAKFNMQNAKVVSTPMESNIKISKEMGPSNEEERIEMKKKPYRELIGGLIYLANATRPDIAFAAGTLSRYSSDPGKTHWELAKRVLRYLKDTIHYGIHYVKDKERLRAYTDTDWAGDIDDRRSCSGNVIVLAGGPVSWKSKKQSSVSLSTMEAEYVALSEISREIVYMNRLLNHIGCKECVETPIVVHCDNQCAIELTKNAVFHNRSKHIDIGYHYTRELVDRGLIKIIYLSTEYMIADIFTKALSKIKHQKCVSMLNMVN